VLDWPADLREGWQIDTCSVSGPQVQIADLAGSGNLGVVVAHIAVAAEHIVVVGLEVGHKAVVGVVLESNQSSRCCTLVLGFRWFEDGCSSHWDRDKFVLLSEEFG